MSRARFRLGCFIPQGWRADLPEGVDGAGAWTAALDVARRAERSGYQCLWVYDHLQTPAPYPPAPVLDPLLLLTAASQVTSRIRVGTMCLAVPLHHPAQLAHQLACLDGLSGGRLEVGLGGGSDPLEARAFGIDFPPVRERILAAGEVAEVLRACWRHDSTSYEGRYATLVEARCLPRPMQPKLPPILIAGGGDLTLWQAARHGDGCSLFGPPERVAAKLEVLEERCRLIGRRVGELRVAVVLDCLIADSEAQADALVDRYNRHGEDIASFRARRLVGTPQACAQQLQRYLDLGVSDVCCYFPDAAEDKSLERLAAAVLAPAPSAV